MGLPVWSEDYMLGQEVIDQEHHRLLDLLHWLEAELLSDEHDLDMAKVTTLVHELTNHSVVHFLHEESLMATLTTMPKTEKEAHKESHQYWKRRIQENVEPMRGARTDLERRAHLARILLVGKSFWEEHYEKIDRKMEAHIRAQNLARQPFSSEE